MKDIILSTHNLTKKYDKVVAVDKVNMELRRGEIYGLVGKNGAGKTTFLRMITGQTFVTEGSISLFGSTGSKLNQERRKIGAIIEIPSFYSYLTAEQNLEYYRRQMGIPGKDCVKEALQEVNLTDTGNKKFKSFSLGMKQRLGLAFALMNKPELLLLDEPINGLDPFGIVEIRNLLIRLSKERNITILISSHILSELTNVATCYGFIENGKMIRQLTADELANECKKYMELKVDNVEAMIALLETKLNCSSYRITPDYTIQLYEYLDQPSVISNLAVSNGIALNSLTVKDINLENYFIQLVGGEANA